MHTTDLDRDPLTDVQGQQDIPSNEARAQSETPGVAKAEPETETRSETGRDATSDPRELGGSAISEEAQPDDLIFIRNLQIERGNGVDDFVVDVPILRIPRGSFTSILGTSGCGKTSLLLVLGLLRVSGEDDEFRISCDEMLFQSGGDEEAITIFRQVTAGFGGQRLSPEQVEDLRQRLIGFCLQGGELVPSLNLEDNVAVPARLGGLSGVSARSEERLDELRMRECLGLLPGQLSGGQGQRGVLARALVHDPPLILLDEPTSALDRPTAEEAIGLLQERARQRGQTIIMVTHDQELAQTFSHRIISMVSPQARRGKVDRVQDIKRTEAPEHGEPSATGDRTGTAPEEATALDPTPCHGEPAAAPQRPGGLRRGIYYLQLAWLDAMGPLGKFLARRTRAETATGRFTPLGHWSTYTFFFQLIKNSLIAVALGLLVLMLHGLRSGLVEEFRQGLVKSPTARELTITPMGASGGLADGDLEALRSAYPQIEMILPQTRHVVSLDPEPGAGQSLTLLGTLPQDPKLAALYPEQNFSSFESGSLIISASLASELGLSRGETLEIWITRALDADGRDTESHAATLHISHVLEDTSPKTAYGHLALLQQVADYKAGRPVPEFDWPGFPNAAAPRYASYLVFSKRPFSGREERMLTSRGLVFEGLDATDPRSHLMGRLKSAEQLEAMSKPPLLAYEVRSGRQDGDLKWLDGSLAEQVGDLLINSDAILIPWNPPLEVQLGEASYEILGLSGSVRWLKGYLEHRRAVFPRRETTWQVAFGSHQDDPGEGEVSIADLPWKLKVAVHGEPPTATAAPVDPASAKPPVTASPDTDPTAASPEAKDPTTAPPSQAPWSAPLSVLTVPAPFLAHLHMAKAGLVEPDFEARAFRRRQDDVVYYQARIFVEDVFQVASLHDALSDRFGVRSNQARVREVQRYSQILDLLVNILTVMAVGIALATVYMVFHEVALRKKRMLGTLRILGLPRSGVLALLLVRGLLVALVASFLIYLVGQVTAITLNWAYDQQLCLLTTADYLGITAGVIGVCFLAVLLPAWQVSRLDPIVALEQAKLNG